MSSDKDNEASNESDGSPEVQITAVRGQATSAGGVERFASAAIDKAVRRSVAHAERIKRLKIEMRINTKSSQATDRLATCCTVLGITFLKVVQDVKTRR